MLEPERNTVLIEWSVDHTVSSGGDCLMRIAKGIALQGCVGKRFPHTSK
jgi:hypothetical protein